MISFAIAKTVFSYKLGHILWALPFTAIAVTEAFLGQMVISLIVALIGATPPTIAIILMARKQSEERRIAQATLMQRQDKMAEDLDGKLDRLSVAERGKERAEGIIEGGDKERASAAATPVASGEPMKMEIVNPKSRPVPTIPGTDSDAKKEPK